jgi:hypothetical protein
MRRFLIPAVVLVASLSLAGCSAVMSEEAATISDSGGAPEAAYESEGEGQSVPRQVIVTGSMIVTVDAPADAAADAARIAEASGGRVDARSETAPTEGDKGRATLTLRLPSEGLQATLDKIKALGSLEQLDLETSDVTTEVEDLDARISALEKSLARLRVLLSKARTIADLITLETEITSRQGELESLQSQQRYYADQVDLSTIDLTLISEADAPVDTPDTFLSGLAAGWASFVAFISGLLVVVGALIPWAIFLGILGAAVYYFIRWRIRRKTQA